MGGLPVGGVVCLGNDQVPSFTCCLVVSVIRRHCLLSLCEVVNFCTHAHFLSLSHTHTDTRTHMSSLCFFFLLTCVYGETLSLSLLETFPHKHTSGRKKSLQRKYFKTEKINFLNSWLNLSTQNYSLDNLPGVPTCSTKMDS